MGAVGGAIVLDVIGFRWTMGSFVGGVFVVAANIAWIGLMLYYQKSKKGGQD